MVDRNLELPGRSVAGVAFQRAGVATLNAVAAEHALAMKKVNARETAVIQFDNMLRTRNVAFAAPIALDQKLGFDNRPRRSQHWLPVTKVAAKKLTATD